jgi:effector-binding domain-containing protein
MVYEISMDEIPAQRIMSIRGSVARGDVPDFIDRSFADLRSHLRLLGVRAVAGPFVIYHVLGTSVDTEACVPVAGDILAVGRISTRSLPATTVARTVHVGPHEELRAAYAALVTWMGQRGYEAVGPVRERYIDGPGGSTRPADYRTVVELPIAAVAVHA